MIEDDQLNEERPVGQKEDACCGHGALGLLVVSGQFGERVSGP